MAHQGDQRPELEQVIMHLQAQMESQRGQIGQLQQHAQHAQEQAATQSGLNTEKIAAALQSSTQAQRSTGPKKRTKAIGENPSAFDGKNRTHYAAFRFKLRSKMEIDRDHWVNEFERLMHMFSCLTGSAETALRPWVEANAADKNSVKITTDDFFEKLDDLFEDRESQDRAYAKLLALRQGGTSFNDHFATFQRLLMESGENTMSDRGKKATLRNTLSDELRHILVGVGERESFEDFSRQLQGIADRQKEERARLRNPRGQFTRQEGKGARPSTSSTAPSPAPDVMDWEPTAARGQSTPARRARWVDEAERQRRRTNGVCLRCGGKGHRIAVCPFLPANPPAQTGAVAACDVPDAVLEEEGPSERESEKA